jgi:starch synthase
MSIRPAMSAGRERHPFNIIISSGKLHVNVRRLSQPTSDLSVLFVVSEAHPLMKTGGLADVAGSLPPALARLGVDVRLLMPAYRDSLASAGTLRPVTQARVPGYAGLTTLLEGRLPGTRVRIWLLDHPPSYDRPGNPYLDESGQPWDDNAERYALLCRIAVEIAQGRLHLDWRPAVVHCHDWQSGLTPALLSLEQQRPATVFTIHNLAYQGLFPYETFMRLGLPPHWWAFDRLEFFNQLSFIKGGLVYADKLTTVSPTYAQEIQTPAYGSGLDGLLRHRTQDLSGILNGIDDRTWNPAGDTYLAATYNRRQLAGKATNKLALQQDFRLPVAPDVPVIGMVGRMVEQKGIDLVIDALPHLLRLPLQVVILGTGDSGYARALSAMAARHPQKLSVHIGYDERTAHRIEAGADVFLMPSRFEPCGLNQLYSLRYGTVPIVRNVGGLADTVMDATPANLAATTATGFVFEHDEVDDLIDAVERALALFRQPAAWKSLQLAGMAQDYTWSESARRYLDLYGALTTTRRQVAG